MKRDMGLPVRALSLVALAWGFLPTGAGAQAIHARVLDSIGVRPLSGAVVQVESRSGVLVSRTLTSADGRATVELATAGEYVLRVEMIGRETKTMPFEVFDDLPTIRREVRLAERPILLEGLDVAANQRCTIAPDAGESVRQLWDEARKALVATATAEEEGLYDFETMVYERDLDRELIRLEGLEEEQQEKTLRAPFVTKSAQDLLDRGFLERADGSDIYYAPDAYLLLSDGFLANHCFTVASHEPATGDTVPSVGLSFRPLTTEGQRVDIQGTLWLDSRSSELRFLEYQYANLPPVRRDPRVGGEVAFQRMPEGRWVVTEWLIRMPSISLQRDADFRVREFVSGFREAGGIVLEATFSGEAVVRGTSLGVLSGTVVGPRGEPIDEARVDLEGTSRSAVTEADGSFSFERLPDGLYQMLATSARWRSLGLSPAVRGVRVSSEDQPVVSIMLDAEARITTECRAQIPDRPLTAPSGAWPPGEGVLVVEVLDESNQPTSGASVRVAWTNFAITIAHAQPRGRGRRIQSAPTSNDVPVTTTVTGDGFGYEGTSDESGRVRFCGVVEGTQLTVSGQSPVGPLGEVTLGFEEADRVRHVVLRPSAR